MAKRQGLGKASKAKKQKPEAASAEQSAQAQAKQQQQQQQPEAEPEVEITLEDGDTDEELAEVYGLYTKMRADRDPRLARGLVHECNELLRARDTAGETLPPKFHVVYAGGLFTLAAESGKQGKEFADAAFERLAAGTEAAEVAEAEAEAAEGAKLEAAGIAAYELVQFAHTQLDAERGGLSKRGAKAHKRALELLQPGCVHIEAARGAELLMRLQDDLGAVIDLPLLADLARSADAETKRLGHKCLAQTEITRVAPLLDDVSGDDEGAEEEKAVSVSPEAAQGLRRAAEHLKEALSEEDPSSYVMLAETLLSLEEDEEEALRLLKKARILGADGLAEIIEELSG